MNQIKLGEASPAFQEFLDLIGDKIKLLDWKKYRGGLDVKGNNNHARIFIFE